ncbi:MAG: YigZ family protein [Rhodobacteraceae bacterium]|nr:YigZ family protein [Paracoccaceae bacterium]
MQHLGVVSDRGSKYAASAGVVRSQADIKAFLKQLKRAKKFAKASHNTWAARLADGTEAKNDDGEGGAGMIILQMMAREELEDAIIVVTRWYGGTHLGGDRFRHVKTSVQHLFDQLR